MNEGKTANKTIWIVLGVIGGMIILITILVLIFIAVRSSKSANCDNPLIKGNISQSGERIYHLPGDEYYSRTVINEDYGEKWFCTEKEAKQSGWRHSKV